MNELGISEQNIAKYLAMGFDIVNEKKKREEVEKRCQNLETYYLEKLELTKKSANSGNAAGFFIKALKEDWINSKTLQKSKAEKGIKERRKAEKALKSLNSNIEKLNNQKKKLKASIIAQLIEETTILKAAYDNVIASMTDFMKGHISNVVNLPLREQYEQAVGISSGVDVYLMKHYSDHFKEVLPIDEKIEQAQKEIQRIRKKHPSIK